MHCWIYRSPRKQEMYLYLAIEDVFDAVPAELLERFGTPEHFMSLELTPDRTLARVDITQVRSNLQTLGYHLQMPPTLVPELYHGNDM